MAEPRTLNPEPSSPSQPVSQDHPPEWRLPQGVPRGVWEYARAEHIAAEYDAYFAGTLLFDYRRIPKMYVHSFTRGELVRDLRAAGFRVRRLIPLDVTRQRPLRWPWLFGRLRANGWIAVWG